MATLEDNLHAHLAARAGLIAIVGTRIFKVRLPHRTSLATSLPCLVFQRVGGASQYHQGGECTLTSARIQFTAWATTYTVAKTVIEAVRDAISGFKGSTWGSGGTATTILWAERVGDQIDLSEGPEDGSDSPLFGLSEDYEIRHRQAVPTLA